MLTKICERCGQKYTPTGNFQKYCPDCRTKHYKEYNIYWRQLNREQKKEHARAYYRANKERHGKSVKNWREKHSEEYKNYVRKYNRLYYLAHREKERERHKKYREASLEQIKSRLAKWREANREHLREYAKKYFQIHPEVKATSHARRRVKLEEATIEEVNPRYIYKRDNWICQICGKKVNPKLKYPNPMSASLDHIIPLSLGGTHERKNLQLAHRLCNERKGKNGHDQLRLIG